MWNGLFRELRGPTYNFDIFVLVVKNIFGHNFWLGCLFGLNLMSLSRYKLDLSNDIIFRLNGWNLEEISTFWKFSIFGQKFRVAHRGVRGGQKLFCFFLIERYSKSSGGRGSLNFLIRLGSRAGARKLFSTHPLRPIFAVIKFFRGVKVVNFKFWQILLSQFDLKPLK